MKSKGIAGAAAVLLAGGLLVSGADVSASAQSASHSTARAATTKARLLYSYNLAHVVSGRVPNSARAHRGAALHLQGSWHRLAPGVHFAGNTTNKRSIGHANPSVGQTINVPPSRAVAFGIRFVFDDQGMRACARDSGNLTQIGRYAAHRGQLKIETSGCSVSPTLTFPRCRIAGFRTSVKDQPVIGKTRLVDGATYVVMCGKAPDPATGDAHLFLRTVRIWKHRPPTATVASMPVHPTGWVRTTKDLSVANKSPLPRFPENTDQYVGVVAKVAYCQGATLLSVRQCVAGQLMPR